MNKKELEKEIKQYIDIIKCEFYGSLDFKLFGLYDVVSQVNTEENFGNNASLVVYDASTAGVEVTDGLFLFCTDNSIRFAACHELGHAFSQQLLSNVGMHGAGGAVTEIIADLGAAYILNQSGMSWDEIVAAVEQGAKEYIFDANWDGDHPPAKTRISTVRILAEVMKKGKPFPESARAICRSCQSLKSDQEAVATAASPSARVPTLAELASKAVLKRVQ